MLVFILSMFFSLRQERQARGGGGGRVRCLKYADSMEAATETMWLLAFCGDSLDSSCRKSRIFWACTCLLVCFVGIRLGAMHCHAWCRVSLWCGVVCVDSRLNMDLWRVLPRPSRGTNNNTRINYHVCTLFGQFSRTHTHTHTKHSRCCSLSFLR